jgi:hypothetical protein
MMQPTHYVTRIARHASRITHHASRLAHHDLTLVVAAALVARVLAIIALRVWLRCETGPTARIISSWGRFASGAYPFIDYWTE